MRDRGNTNRGQGYVLIASLPDDKMESAIQALQNAGIKDIGGRGGRGIFGVRVRRRYAALAKEVLQADALANQYKVDLIEEDDYHLNS